MLPRTLVLPVDALTRLVSWEVGGELHPALAPAPLWRPPAAEDEGDRAARAHLAEQGLLGRGGRVDVEVAAALAVLCRPRVEFYGWLDDRVRTVGVLAGAIGREAVVAVRDGDAVTLRQARFKRLPETLVARIPKAPPGRGDRARARRSELVASGPAGAQARLVQRVARLPVVGSGELHVAVRDELGRRRRAPHPLRYADTAHGRWLNEVAPLPDGDAEVEVVPAAGQELAARLRRMHLALTRP